MFVVRIFELHFASSYSAGGKERGHRVVDSLLGVAERIVCGIRAAVAVEGIVLEGFADGGDILRRYYTVGVEEYEIVAFGMFESVVAGYRSAFVGLIEVLGVEILAFKFLYDVLAGVGRAVFDYD